jgi:hypothetical protein
MSMRSEMCSPSCSDGRGVSRDAVHDDRNAGEGAHIPTAGVAFTILSVIAIQLSPILAIIISTAINTISSSMGTAINSSMGTAISSSVWRSCRSCCCGSVGSEVGGLSGSDLGGVVDWQGCSVGNARCVGVAETRVSWTGIHHTDRGEAEEEDLKGRTRWCSGIPTVCWFICMLINDVIKVE